MIKLGDLFKPKSVIIKTPLPLAGSYLTSHAMTVGVVSATAHLYRIVCRREHPVSASSTSANAGVSVSSQISDLIHRSHSAQHVIGSVVARAFWERSEKPPLSDVFPKMAQALGVSVEDLLVVGDEKPLRKKAAKSNSRPAGKVREVFDRVSKLPRRQQEHIVNLDLCICLTTRAIQTMIRSTDLYIFLTASNFPSGSLVTKPSNIQMPRIATPSNSPSRRSPASSRRGAESKPIFFPSISASQFPSFS